MTPDKIEIPIDLFNDAKEAIETYLYDVYLAKHKGNLFINKLRAIYAYANGCMPKAKFEKEINKTSIPVSRETYIKQLTQVGLDEDELVRQVNGECAFNTPTECEMCTITDCASRNKTKNLI